MKRRKEQLSLRFLGTMAGMALMLVLSGCGGGGGGGSGGSGSSTSGSGGGGSSTTSSLSALGWGSATPLASVDASTDNIFTVAANINTTGTAAVVWGDNPDPGTVVDEDLYANVYQNGAWGTPFQFPEVETNQASVAVTPAGDAMVVYIYTYWGTTTSGAASSSVVYSRFYDHGTNTWSTTPTLIAGSATTGTEEEDPVAVSDSNGNVMAVWDTGTQVYASYYDATSGTWSPPAQLSNSPDLVYTPTLVVGGNNVFTAAWIQDSSVYTGSNRVNNPEPYASQVVSGLSTWSTPSYIGVNLSTLANNQGAQALYAAANGLGDVFEVWEQQSNNTSNVAQTSVDAAQFNPANQTWSTTPTSIAANTSDDYSWPEVAVDGTGNAMAVWTLNSIATGNGVAQSASYTASAGSWGNAQEIDQGNGDDVENVIVGMDSSGNAEAIWNDTTTGTTIEHHYDATGGAGWGTSFNVLSPTARSPILSMSSTGYAVLLGESETYTTVPFLDNAWAYILTP